MSDRTTTEPNGSQPSTSIPTGGTPTSGNATSPEGQPPVPASAPWRAPDSAPAWARGRTPEEILALSEQMATFIENQQRMNAPAPPPPAPPSQGLNPDDYVTGRDVQQYAQQWAQQTVSPQVEAGIALAADANLGLVRRERKEDFQRWGPEITMHLSRVPRSQWTLDNINRIVQYVRAEHLPELEREIAARFEQTGGLTMRSDGSLAHGSVSQQPTDPMASAPEEWRKKAADAGLTLDGIKDFARENGMTVEEFFAQMQSGKVVAGGNR